MSAGEPFDFLLLKTRLDQIWEHTSDCRYVSRRLGPNGMGLPWGVWDKVDRRFVSPQEINAMGHDQLEQRL
jgi:hypothetical protein